MDEKGGKDCDLPARQSLLIIPGGLALRPSWPQPTGLAPEIGARSYPRCVQRSTPPITGSIDPMTATTSAMR